MAYYFVKFFIHLLTISTICCFRFYQLTGWELFLVISSFINWQVGSTFLWVSLKTSRCLTWGFLKEQQIFLISKFSKCFTTSSYSSYLSWKGFNFSSHLWLLKINILQIKYEHGCDENFSYFNDIFPSTSYTGSCLRNSCFFDSLFCNK